MTTLLYIHGFLSSPESTKAQQVKDWLARHHPDITFQCPQLPPYPKECAQQLTTILGSSEKPIYLMGSSMGGFWATWLAETFQLKAVLINPAVAVLKLIPNYLHQTLINFHHSEKYYLTEQHIQELKQYIIEKLTDKKNYWLLVQTGDQTLDYRLAVEKYQGCRCTIEPGGDHSFQGFERYLEKILYFYETP